MKYELSAILAGLVGFKPTGIMLMLGIPPSNQKK